MRSRLAKEHDLVVNRLVKKDLRDGIGFLQILGQLYIKNDKETTDYDFVVELY
jgi:hypothetical protein